MDGRKESTTFHAEMETKLLKGGNNLTYLQNPVAFQREIPMQKPTGCINKAESVINVSL